MMMMVILNALSITNLHLECKKFVANLILEGFCFEFNEVIMLTILLR